MDLQVVVDHPGAYHGQATQNLVLVNHARDACSLTGAPRIELLGAGTSEQVDLGSAATQRVDLAPGQSVQLLIGTPGSCPGAGRIPRIIWSSAQLTLPSGDVIPVSGIWVNTECGSPHVMALLTESIPPPSQSPLSSLKGSISAPVSVARGTVLTYQVTLRNPGQAPVAFSPCPSYTEFLGIGGSPSQVVRSFLLNCAAAKSIGAGSSLTYQMQLSVPQSFPTGPTKLAWKLDPDGPGFGTAIRVT